MEGDFDQGVSISDRAWQLLTRSLQGARPADYLADVLPAIAVQSQADYLAVVGGDAGQWAAIAETGPRRALPAMLLADVLSRDAAEARGEWAAVALPQSSGAAEALAAHATNGARSADTLAVLRRYAAALAPILELLRTRHQDQRRIRRLEAILGITQKWNQTQEVRPLLNQMAEAATRLLDADRASIFLWDRRATCWSGDRHWESREVSCAFRTTGASWAKCFALENPAASKPRPNPTRSTPRWTDRPVTAREASCVYR